MPKKVNFHLNKALKLNNVLFNSIDLKSSDINFDLIVNKMNSYITLKGSKQLGPLVQYTASVYDSGGVVDVEIKLMLQCSNFIHKVEPPYSMESVIRVPNCMYCRYIGPEDKLKFAYDKIHLEAFENDIELEDCSYTIFVDRNEEEETIVADVFIPRKDVK